MSDRSTIAVVDDDESVRESLPDLLRSLGFSAIPFASGPDFLASAAIEEIDCLVLDIAMPAMSGPELQQELRRRNHDIPIIFITANSDKTSLPGLLRAGAVACLLKPFSEEAISNAIDRALGQK